MPLAAVRDGHDWLENYAQLRYEPRYGYFNSGVLLINLAYWREHDCISDFLRLIRDEPDRIKQHDQDVLNICFHTAKADLPIRYNVQESMLSAEALSKLAIPKNEYQDALLHPAIIHFSGYNKPWHRGCYNPYRQLFDEYRRQTHWKHLWKHYRTWDVKFMIGNTLRSMHLLPAVDHGLEDLVYR